MAGSKVGADTGKTTQTTVNSLDPTTKAWTDAAMHAAQGAGAAGPSPLTTGATDYYGGQMAAGNLGMGALSGDPNAIARLMNPYQQNVIDATNKQFDKSGLLAVQGANQAATGAGAYGGSRSGVLAGTAQAANELNRNSTVSGLLYGGYGQAMGQAGTLANFGQAGANANANLGMAGVGNPDQWMLNMLTQLRGNPYGTSQGVSSSHVGANMSGWVL